MLTAILIFNILCVLLVARGLRKLEDLMEGNEIVKKELTNGKPRT